MLKFTSLFSGKCAGSTSSLNSTMPSTTCMTLASGTGTMGAGSSLLDDKPEVADTTTGCLSIYTGATLAINSYSSYDRSIQQMETTQAYIESLSETELAELMTRLEAKETELATNEEKHGKTI